MKPIKILLLGKNGQVGWELQRALSPIGQLVCAGREEANFSDPEKLRELTVRHSPDIIVNAAAYTAVDKAESEPDQAFLVNAEAVAVLAEEAARIGAWLVHYSTDYVFDGEKNAPYLEDDEPHPLSVYGKSKLEGERHIRERHPGKHLILRTSWVYSTWGANFAKTMLRLAREKDTLSVVADQYGAPTSAELIADATALALYHILRSKEDAAGFSGTYHLTASGYTSWHGYARFVLELAGARGFPLKVSPSDLREIPTESYPLPASRPKNSRLDTNKFASRFNAHLPDWRWHVERMMKELSG